MGVDPGLNRTGWAVLSGGIGSPPRLEAAGLLHTPAGRSLEDRLADIFNGLRKLIAGHSPSCLAVEEVYFMKAASSVAATIQARGVILLAAKLEGRPVKSYNPRTVKMTLTGNGNALKSQMQRMVQLTLGLEETLKPDDVADAAAIALCHLRRGTLVSKINASLTVITENSKFQASNPN
ncbi:MAG: crossover junction endodeoxyribonuclease RuvC [bacterium]